MEAVATQKPKVLIIDDEEQIRNLLIDVLGNSYQCSDAGSAEEALAALANTTFDLVISDIDMGGMSGLELVPRVHSLSPDTVVVMVSGNQDIEFAIARCASELLITSASRSICDTSRHQLNEHSTTATC